MRVSAATANPPAITSRPRAAIATARYLAPCGERSLAPKYNCRPAAGFIAAAAARKRCALNQSTSTKATTFISAAAPSETNAVSSAALMSALAVAATRFHASGKRQAASGCNPSLRLPSADCRLSKKFFLRPLQSHQKRIGLALDAKLARAPVSANECHIVAKRE